VADEANNSNVRCNSCGKNPIEGNRYKCNSCFHYDICEKCFTSNAPTPASYISHKTSHKFTKISLQTAEAIQQENTNTVS